MAHKVCRISVCILLLLIPVKLEDCMGAWDVVFVLYAGPNLSLKDRELMMNLTKDAANQLHPSYHGTHVALIIQSSNEPTVVQRLQAALVFNSTITELFATSSTSALQTSISIIRNQVLDNTYGDRPEVQDVIVIISDKLSNDRDAHVPAAAAELKSEGIKIITVGVTSTEVDKLREELRGIATDPQDISHLMLTSPNYYLSVLSHLVKKICRKEIEADNWSLRLVDGTSNSGRLEVYIHEEWATVCSINWTVLNTKIACQQLGYPDGQKMYVMNQTSYFRRVGVDSIQCTGNESNLHECPHNLFDTSCNHRQDVFLQCLCADCNDYTQRDNVRLADQNPISGRLEVFSPGSGWGGVCADYWVTENTRVACRQLGYYDGAGSTEIHQNHTLSLVLYDVTCSGTEMSLFDCRYSTSSSGNCSQPVYIQCECDDCQQLVLQAPQVKYVRKGSSAVFEWHLSRYVSYYEFQFLSQKNVQTLLSVSEGKVIVKHSGFHDRILLTDNQTTIGFTLHNITTADMGIYALNIPQLLFDSHAVLFVTNFASVPNAVLHRDINDYVMLNWDLTSLRKFGEINHEIFLRTPVTGKIPLNFYYKQWLQNNLGRHEVPEIIDYLQPTVVINQVTAEDGGRYTIDVSVTSPIYHWMNESWQFATNLIIYPTEINNTGGASDGTRNSSTEITYSDTDSLHPTENIGIPNAVVIVLGVLLGISMIVNTAALICFCCCSTCRETATNSQIKNGTSSARSQGSSVLITDISEPQNTGASRGRRNVTDGGGQVVSQGYIKVDSNNTSNNTTNVQAQVHRSLTDTENNNIQ